MLPEGSHGASSNSPQAYEATESAKTTPYAPGQLLRGEAAQGNMIGQLPRGRRLAREPQLGVNAEVSRFGLILGNVWEQRGGATAAKRSQTTHEPHACVAVASLIVAAVRPRAARVVAAPRLVARPWSCRPRFKPTTASDQRGLQATGSTGQGACDAATGGTARGGTVRLGRTSQSNDSPRARLTTDRRHSVGRRTSRRLTPPALSDCGPAIIQQQPVHTYRAAWQHVGHFRGLALRCCLLCVQPACRHE